MDYVQIICTKQVRPILILYVVFGSVLSILKCFFFVCVCVCVPQKKESRVGLKHHEVSK